MIRIIATAAVLAVATVPSTVSAQGFRDVEIKTTKLADHIYMLEGRGGNMGLCTGEDGAFLVDDQFAPLTGKIEVAVEEVSENPVKFVANTHWHGDHTGGNENFGKAGALIVAHENVRRRMSVDSFIEAFDRTVPAAPADALPVITFAEDVTFHWNEEEIHVFHVGPAHTDGDSVVHFKDSNVLHMGDVYFNGMYPFIDVSSGGRIDGIIAVADAMISLTNGETKIIPGHGPLSNRAELRAYRDMLKTARDAIKRMKDEGKTREEIIEAKPTAHYDDKWGGGFMDPTTWVGIVYDSLS